jgi:predicted RND superfamily exporter protein
MVTKNMGWTSRWRSWSLTRFSVDHPLIVLLLILLVTIAFGLQLPQIRTDTDPKNMLPATSPVRVYNDQVDARFQLHKDTIVLGVINEGPEGIFNEGTLQKIVRISDQILQLKGVVARDVTGLTTVDHISADGNDLKIRVLMRTAPTTPEGIAELKQKLFAVPLYQDRLISRDGTTTAIYIPLQNGTNAEAIANQIRAIIAKEAGGPARFYLTGDPIVRDTFGTEMFKQMAIFSPLAGLAMFLILFLMFRNLPLVFSIMGAALISIIWTMGLHIGLSFPVHIMSSMIPVFLIALATDSVHIFNEFYFRYHDTRAKRRAILETMEAVGRPVRYTALAAAVGFGTLALAGLLALYGGKYLPLRGTIVPVMVFGAFMAFGTLAIRVLSFSFIPAVLALVSEKGLEKRTATEDLMHDRVAHGLGRLGRFSVTHRVAVLVVTLLFLIAAGVGMSRIHVNNNMIDWFKPGSEIRQADRALNARLGGTAPAYLVLRLPQKDAVKQPETLRYLQALQRDLERLPTVGKTFSIVDYVTRINRVMHQDDPAFETIPDSASIVAQYLLLFSMSAKPSDLNNVVDFPYQQANIWLQLKSWDAGAMQSVIDEAQRFSVDHPLVGAQLQPAGTAYFNLVWNEEVLYGMLEGFLLASLLVLLILVLDLRSWRWGLVAFIPLFVTIVLIYGFIGWRQIDFDMPVAVLSTLSLGMAVDFAIHFTTRLRQRYAEQPDLAVAVAWTVARPGKGIMRNALLFAVSFAVMLASALTPYVTVGIFVMAIMLLSAGVTLMALPALVYSLRRWLPGLELQGAGAQNTVQTEAAIQETESTSGGR